LINDDLLTQRLLLPNETFTQNNVGLLRLLIYELRARMRRTEGRTDGREKLVMRPNNTTAW